MRTPEASSTSTRVEDQRVHVTHVGGRHGQGAHPPTNAPHQPGACGLGSSDRNIPGPGSSESPTGCSLPDTWVPSTSVTCCTSREDVNSANWCRWFSSNCVQTQALLQGNQTGHVLVSISAYYLITAPMKPHWAGHVHATSPHPLISLHIHWLLHTAARSPKGEKGMLHWSSQPQSSDPHTCAVLMEADTQPGLQGRAPWSLITTFLELSCRQTTSPLTLCFPGSGVFP